MKILLVEDDPSIADLLNQALSNQHYLVDVATDGQTGWELADAFDYELIVLDLVLPKLDGISFCRQRRQKKDFTPILLLTAQNHLDRKIQGLDAGADDYMVKPFDVAELLARIRALLRRGKDALNPILEWGGLSLEPDKCQVTYQGKLLKLTAKEYELLELFLRNPQRIFSQSALLDHLWSFDQPPSETAVRTQIKGLRRKLKQAGASSDLIETVYGLGYRLGKLTNQQESSVKVRKDGKNAKPTNPSLNALWEKYRSKYFQRLQVIKQGIEALEAGNLEEDLHHQALREAHTLAGSLGSFGFTHASTYCRQLEQVFQTQEKLTSSAIAHANQLLKELYEQLSHSNVTRNGHENATDSATESAQESQNAPSISPESNLTNNLITPSPSIWENESHSSSSRENVAKIMAVDDDPQILDLLGNLLEPWGFQLTLLSAPQQFWQSLTKVRPDLLILDVEMPVLSGIDLCKAVRNDPNFQSTPIIFLSAYHDVKIIQQVFSVGADDYVSKPIVAPELIARVQNRLDRDRYRRQLEVLDPLTGLTNRYQSIPKLLHLLNLAKRQNQPWCLMLLTLDHFPEVNQRYGHQTGEQILRYMGNLLKQTFRGEDVIARWGQKEFILGMYDMNYQDAVARLTEFLERFRQTSFLGANQQQFQVTFSAGVAAYPHHGNNFDLLYQGADDALSQAKNQGASIRYCQLT